MNTKLIKKLRAGKIAIDNVKGNSEFGNAESLNKIIRAANPSNGEVQGLFPFYYLMEDSESSKDLKGIYGKESIPRGMPRYPVSKFLEDEQVDEQVDEQLSQPEFTRGELVEVRDSDNIEWQKRIFVIYIDGERYPYRCVAFQYEESFKAGEKFLTSPWVQCRKIQVETAGDKLADKIIEATANDEIITDIEHDEKAKTITIKYK